MQKIHIKRKTLEILTLLKEKKEFIFLPNKG